jgi:ubiquinone biosynthesis protein
MVFEAGTFHADPHPGNIFIEPDGRIGLIDFGMVGILDDATREQLAELFLAISREDVEGLVDALVHIGIVLRVDSLELLKRDLNQLFDRYYHRSLGDIRVGQLLSDVLTVTRHHHLQFPSNLFLLIKTLIMSEGLGAQLDPDYNLSVLIKPYATKMLLQRYNPAYWGKRLGRVGGDLLWLGMELPAQLRRLARASERGNLVLPMHPVGLEAALQRLEGMVNRLVLGMVLAAFLVGLALLMTVYHPLGSERWMGVLFGFGFTVVLLLGAYLIRGMIKRGRGSK